MRVDSVRDGWMGKTNAMDTAVSASNATWLCFTDPDCRQLSRRTITMAVSDAVEHEADLLTVTPRLVMPTAWEKIIQPVCVLTLVMWFSPKYSNDPKKKTAYANGAFMLMRRRCYEAVGGYERVRSEINEDIRMARMVKDAGHSVRVAETEDLYESRMYDTPAAAWRGWRRIFFNLRSAWRVGVAMGSLLFTSVLPWICLAVALAGLCAGGAEQRWNWGIAAASWAIAIAVCQYVAWRIYGLMHLRWPWSLSYPLAALAVLAVLASTLLAVSGVTTVTWRGTTYRRGRPV